MLNYGDAVAHLHIARRVFDSRRPGFSELGSVWLPLPHLLMIPFVAVYAWWANGVAGWIPSAAAYLAGCAGHLPAGPALACPAAIPPSRWPSSRSIPTCSIMQTTAMTEPLLCVRDGLGRPCGWWSGAPS